MSKLFELTEINGMQLSNRFVRSATWEGMAEDDAWQGCRRSSVFSEYVAVFVNRGTKVHGAPWECGALAPPGSEARRRPHAHFNPRHSFRNSAAPPSLLVGAPGARHS